MLSSRRFPLQSLSWNSFNCCMFIYFSINERFSAPSLVWLEIEILLLNKVNSCCLIYVRRIVVFWPLFKARFVDDRSVRSAFELIRLCRFNNDDLVPISHVRWREGLGGTGPSTGRTESSAFWYSSETALSGGAEMSWHWSKIGDYQPTWNVHFKQGFGFLVCIWSCSDNELDWNSWMKVMREFLHHKWNSCENYLWRCSQKDAMINNDEQTMKAQLLTDDWAKHWNVTRSRGIKWKVEG